MLGAHMKVYSKKSTLIFCFLLAHCAQSLNAVDSILHKAVIKNDPLELRALLRNSHIRIYIDAPEPQNGWTPLHVAVIQASVACAKILLNSRANPNVPDYFGKTPLAYALAIRDPQIRGLIIYRLFEARWN